MAEEQQAVSVLLESNSAVLKFLQTSYDDKSLNVVLKEVAEKMTKREHKAGDILIRQGEKADRFFLIQSGSCQRTRELDGYSVVVDTIVAGDAPGLLHVLSYDSVQETTTTQFATITALEGTVTWEMSSDELQQLMLANPHIALGFLSSISKKLRDETKKVRKHLDAEGREKVGIKVLFYDASRWVTKNFAVALLEYNKRVTKPEDIMHFDYTADRLNKETAHSAAGYDAVCLFVSDDAGTDAMTVLGSVGVKMIAMRCAGYDKVDAKTALTLGITCARVPAYSPYAVAEHAVSLLMTLNRKVHQAITRIKNNNFNLDGLMGFDMHGKKVGVMGTGKIGQCLCDILLGFGVQLMCNDMYPNEALMAKGGTYVTQEQIWQTCDVVFLMMPLLPSTRHSLNMKTLDIINPKGIVLINTSRGGLVETEALLKGLRTGKIKGAGLDVFENEETMVYKDLSDMPIQNEVVAQLMAFSNVIVTGHQAFFTEEAINKIVSTTISNLEEFHMGKTGKDHPNSFT